MMGVSGLAGDPAYPYHEPPMPPLPLGATGNTVARGFEKLGWQEPTIVIRFWIISVIFALAGLATLKLR